MAPGARARDVQHGIEEITRRFDEHREGMDRFAALLVDASRREEEPVRIAAAWAMQYDAPRREFVLRLREMVASDASVLVRRNAASSLAAQGDPSGRPVLRSMLEPWTVVAPESGTVLSLAATGSVLRDGATAARMRVADGAEVEVRTAVGGCVSGSLVAAGSQVATGAPLLSLKPDASHVLNAAFALGRVGTADDVDLLNRIAAPQSECPDDVRRAAVAAVAAIRAREPPR